MIEIKGLECPDTLIQLPYTVVLEESSANVKKLPKAFVGSGRGIFDKGEKHYGV